MRQRALLLVLSTALSDLFEEVSEGVSAVHLCRPRVESTRVMPRAPDLKSAAAHTRSHSGTAAVCQRVALQSAEESAHKKRRCEYTAVCV